MCQHLREMLKSFKKDQSEQMLKLEADRFFTKLLVPIC